MVWGEPNLTWWTPQTPLYPPHIWAGFGGFQTTKTYGHEVCVCVGGGPLIDALTSTDLGHEGWRPSPTYYFFKSS